MTTATKVNLQKQFLNSCENGDMEKVHELLLKHKNIISIHDNEDEAFRMACICGHIVIAKYLYKFCEMYSSPINIHAYSDIAFRLSCLNHRLDVVKYLCELYPGYSYEIKYNEIVPKIK